MSATRKGANPGPDNEGKSPKDRGKLTPKQLRFIEEYPKDFNATQAAIRAGYAQSGARQEGFRLLTNADVQAAIQAVQRKDAVAAGLDRQRLLENAWLAAEFDSSKLWKMIPKDPDHPEAGLEPQLLHPTEWPEDVRRAMTVVVTARGVEYRPKLAAIDGLEFCMKYAMFEDGGPKADPYAEEIARRTAARVAARMVLNPASR